MISKFNAKGFFKIEHFDKFGRIKHIQYFENLNVDEGLNDILDVFFSSGTQKSNWYLLLFSSNSTPVAGWDYAGIGSDFTEFEDYDEATRPQWVEAGVSSKLITNSASPAQFTMSTGVSSTIYGAALVSYNVKGDNAQSGAKMWCASKFSTARPVTEGEIIKISYTINSQDV